VSALAPRSLLRFVAIASVLFGAFVLVYPFVAPAYRTLVRETANPVLRMAPDPSRVEPGDDGGWRIVPVSGQGTAFSVTADDLDLNHAALILLPSLLLATPGTWRERTRRLGIGMVALFLLHVLSMPPWVAALKCLRHDPDSVPCSYAYSVFGAGSQIYAFVVWGVLTWGVWAPGPAAAEPGSRGAPCPCGSGLKYKRCCGAGEPAARAKAAPR
jgi:hypothetical protein